MLVKIFIDKIPEHKAEIFIKVADQIKVHFKCASVEALYEQIKRFGELGIKWRKAVVAKAEYLGRREIMAKINEYRDGEININEICRDFLPIIRNVECNKDTDFFNLLNNICDVSIKENEATIIREKLFL